MLYLTFGLVVGFVIGILFGRRNTKKVEAALDELKARYEEMMKR